MIEMKSLNGFEVVDAKAREDIEIIKQNGTGGGGSADLSNYYTKEETYSKTEIDNKGYLTTLPEHEHDQFLTEHQSQDNYYTKRETYSKTEVDNAIANIPGGGSNKGGSGKIQINLVENKRIPDETIALLNDAYTYGSEGNDILSKY